MTIESLALVPSWRLGTLLHDARIHDGRSLAELAGVSEDFDVERLAAIERGDRPIGETELAAVVALYGIDSGELVPGRTDLVVDLDRHQLATAGHTQALAGTAPTADEVLACYLSLVYTLRQAEPGSRVPLRQADLDVLSRALALAAPDIEHRLVDLMATPSALVRERSRFLKARVLVPAAGILVAVTVAGAIVVSSGSHEPTPPPTTTGSSTPPASTPSANTPAASAPPANTPAASTPPAGTVDTSVQVSGAATQARNPDGGPGPVVISGDGTTVTDLPPGAVVLGDPQVAVRKPDGSVSQADVGDTPSTAP